MRNTERVMYLDPRRVYQHQDSWNYGIDNYPIDGLASIGSSPKIYFRGERRYKCPKAHGIGEPAVRVRTLENTDPDMRNTNRQCRQQFQVQDPQTR